jgi:hypothetical protein
MVTRETRSAVQRWGLRGDILVLREGRCAAKSGLSRISVFRRGRVKTPSIRRTPTSYADLKRFVELERSRLDVRTRFLDLIFRWLPRV